MNISHEKLTGDIDKINLEGRMDIDGCGAIEIKFSGMTASPRKYIIVDISGVEFLASIGIRLLLITAKAVDGIGGKLVLLNPAENVLTALETAGITKLITTVATLDEAIAAVTA